jgi:trk system potassium uptake protein TrkA
VFQELEADVLAAAIFRKDDYIIPDGSVSIQEGDILYLVGLAENLENVFRYFGKIPARLNKVVIVGGGRAGARIAEHILCHRESVIPGSKWLRRLREVVIGKNVVIIEKDRQKCKELAGRFPKALVIQADISEDGVFAEHNLSNSDLVMAVTDNQELNIVTALYARSLGIPKAAVLVNNTNYAAILFSLRN